MARARAAHIEPMNSTPAPPVIPLSCRVTTPSESRLLSMGPHVLRIRAVHTDRGLAPVHLHYLEDQVLVGITLSSMVYDIARIVATQLGECARLLNHRARPVQLHCQDEHAVVPGPAVEIIVCLHEREGVLMEICFDDLPVDERICRWVIDTLVSTSWQIIEDQR